MSVIEVENVAAEGVQECSVPTVNALCPTDDGCGLRTGERRQNIVSRLGRAVTAASQGRTEKVENGALRLVSNLFGEVLPSGTVDESGELSGQADFSHCFLNASFHLVRQPHDDFWKNIEESNKGEHEQNEWQGAESNFAERHVLTHPAQYKQDHANGRGNQADFHEDYENHTEPDRIESHGRD